MNEQQARQLLERYRQGTAIDEEIKLVENWISSELEEGQWDISPEDKIQFKQDLKNRIDQIRKQEAAETQKPARIIPLWKRLTAAASILLAISIGGYYLVNKTHNTPLTAQNKQDIAPGHNQATLTLADGKKIILTKGLNGKLAQQGNMVIQADAGKAITYTTSGQTDHTITGVSYNTLTTKRGEASPYPLVLPDGSKVWLNAASSVTFPTAFNGKTRTVTLTGEALFEVTHNAKQPFTVKTNNQLVEDIGTTFDVNAYEDEPAAKTTLVEGSVKINGKTILKPGEQSELTGNNLTVSKVDVRDITAWRDGNFRFNEVKLDAILRQAARWYDVDISYQDEALKNKKFGTIATRFGKISQLLHALEVTGEVKFKIEGERSPY